MTPQLCTPAVTLLTTLARPEDVRQQARKLRVVRRQGRVDSYALLMVLTLGLVIRSEISVAQLGQIYGETTGQRLARSSFWDRLSPQLTKLLQWLLDRLVVTARTEAPKPPGLLSAFTDVLVADATVIKVDDALAGVWKGTRRNSAKAALKVHAWIRAFTGELVKYKITPEAFGDSRAFGIDHDLRGSLMLFDRGYASPSLWRRIDSVGGYFLTRVPKGWNQVVVSENRRHRGRARSLVGCGLREVLDGLHRTFVDVNVAFRCRVRGYHGDHARMVAHEFRVVAVRKPDGEYAVYVTNAPEHLLPASAVWSVYRLRWEVETFFKTAKSGSGLSDGRCRARHRVEAMVYAALIRASLAMMTKARALLLVPSRGALRVNHHQWMRWWNRQLGSLLSDLIWQDAMLDTETVIRALADPNQGRVPTRYSFLATG